MVYPTQTIESEQKQPLFATNSKLRAVVYPHQK